MSKPRNFTYKRWNSSIRSLWNSIQT